MKKISTLLIGIIAMMVFTSCDEDVSTAYRLQGDWYGNMGMYYGFTDRYNRYFEVDAYQTNIRFFWDGGSYGHGEQIDLYNAGPYRYQSYYFTWRVIDGVIQMRYGYDSDLDCDIYRWSITHDYDPYTRQYTDVFAGYINDRTSFLLFKLDDFRGWGSYNTSYGYGYEYSDIYNEYYDPYYNPYNDPYYDPYYGHRDYYYGKTRSENGDSVKTDVKGEIKVVKRGSRFFEKE